jgi:hypothetical protein
VGCSGVLEIVMSNNPANARKADAKRLQTERVGMKYIAALREVEKAHRRSGAGSTPAGGTDPQLGTPCAQGWIAEGVVRACEALKGRELRHGSDRQDVRALVEAVGGSREGRRATVTGVAVSRDSVTFDPFGDVRGKTTGRAQVDVWVTVEGLIPDGGVPASTRIPTRWWLDVAVRPESRSVQSVEVLRVRRGTGSSGRARAA